MILQSLSGSEQARSQHLQQYCVDFAELLTAFKILFGPYGPIEYQEVRRQARQDDQWPWKNSAGEEQWPTEIELEAVVGGQLPPVYPIDTDFDMFMPGSVGAAAEDQNDYGPHDVSTATQSHLHVINQQPLPFSPGTKLIPADWFLGDGFGMHKIPHRKPELAKLILHRYTSSDHMLLSTLTSVLNWTLGKQNTSYTIEAYLATKASEKSAISLDLQKTFDMNHMASLLNAESGNESSALSVLIYRGAVKLDDPNSYRHVDEIILDFIDRPLSIPTTTAGYHLTPVASPEQIRQIVFQLNHTTIDGKCIYRTIQRSVKRLQAAWVIKKTEWIFLDPLSLIPFQTVSHFTANIWSEASYAYFFSAPMPHESSRNAINTVVARNFRLRIQAHLERFTTDVHPSLPTRLRPSIAEPIAADQTQYPVAFDQTQDDLLAFPEFMSGSPIRFIQNDADELISLKAAIQSLQAGSRASGAGFDVHTIDEDNSTFRLPHRPFEDRVQGDPVQFLQAAFPHLLYCPDKGASFYTKNRRGEYEKTTSLTFAAFSKKLMQHVDVVPVRDSATNLIVGSRRHRPFCTDFWFVFFCYKRLMYQQLCSIRFTMNPSYRDNLAVDTVSDLLDIQSLSREQLQEAFEALSCQTRIGNHNRSDNAELRRFVEKLLRSLDGFAGGVPGTPMSDTMTK